jgi:hypothetical protein
MEDIIAILPSVSRFVRMHERVMLGEEKAQLPLRWSDAENGVGVQFDGILGDVRSEMPGAPKSLSLAGPTGPGALPLTIVPPGATWDEVVAISGDVVSDFEGYLLSGGAGRAAAARAAKGHAMIAELFVVQFLAGAQGVPLGCVTEFDLRVFLYDWFPRKALMQERDFVKGLGSMRKLFDFAASARGIECPWATPLLRDRSLFLRRLRSKPRGGFLDEQIIDWQIEVYDDIDARVLMHDGGDAGGIQWGAMMGLVEAKFDHLLQRFWLKWRDEIIGSGERDPSKVRAALIKKQHEFERTPAPRANGTPASLIEEERARMRTRGGAPGR